MLMTKVQRRMEGFWVYVSEDGYICLARKLGNYELIESEAIIAIHPSQADSAIEMIMDAQKEGGSLTLERRMEEIEVYASEDRMICFARSCDFPENENEHPELIIPLHTSQVATVIEWIKEVKRELE